jgi:FixJ family two-component response regulator/predicted amino acid-binding ACT domain protein
VKTESKPVILIVDDEEVVLKLLERQLAEVPAKIIPTLSPAEAIHILKSMEVAVLLCDLNMPEISGTAVLKTAREANPNIVSLVVTGGAEISATIKAINEGEIWKYITKPWRQDELVGMVVRALNRYALFSQQQNQLQEIAVNVKAETRKLSQQGKKMLVLSKSHPPSAEPAKETQDGTAPAGKKQIRIVTKPTEKEAAAEKPAAPEAEKGPKGIRLVKATSSKPAPKKTRAERFAEEFQSERYKLGTVLGESPLGVVYRASDSLLSDQVAIKILSKKIIRDEKSIAVLQECSRKAMQLSHKHIIRLHGVEKTGERYYTVMELVDGQSFKDVLNIYRKLPLPTVLQIGRVCADTLAYAYRMQMIHGDLKPTNLLLTGDGVLKVGDFGDGVLLDLQKSEWDPNMLPYMSPERLKGEGLDSRADVYSLGMILYELITGELPFPEDIADIHVLEKGPSSLEKLPAEIVGVFSKALAADRQNRWPSIEDFARALSDVAAM